jgi:hypothetical protein
MKTDINSSSFSIQKSGKMEVYKKLGNVTIKYFIVTAVALLALGICTSSQKINAG